MHWDLSLPLLLLFGCADPLVYTLAGPTESTEDPTLATGSTGCAVAVPDHISLSAPVWGQSDTHFYVPDPAHALGLAWADHQLAGADGLPGIARGTDLLAMALETTGNRCIEGALADAEHGVSWAFDPGTTAAGCFGLPENGGWAVVCRMWPGQIDCIDYSDVIPSTDQIITREDNWANGALVSAHFAVFAGAMWTEQGTADPLGWLDAATDPAARAKMLAISVHESAFSPELGQVIAGCSEQVLENCLTESWLADVVQRVGEHATELSGAVEAGNCYTGEMGRSDVEAFLDTTLRLYAQDDTSSMRSGALAAFDALGEPVGFQEAAPAIIAALEANRLAHLDCPDAMLDQWYGVHCP